MRRHGARWFAGAALVLALVYGLMSGGGRTSVIHGAGPTPTPTSVQTDGSDPGNHSGGGGG